MRDILDSEVVHSLLRRFLYERAEETTDALCALWSDGSDEEREAEDYTGQFQSTECSRGSAVSVWKLWTDIFEASREGEAIYEALQAGGGPDAC